jgi:CRISPR system Cascade subunit CasB
VIDQTWQVGNFARSKIKWLCEANQESQAKALLANLRRGIGKPPGSVVELWGVTFEGMPESFWGKGKPSKEEWAIHTVLTLFALHQQGKDLKKKPMHQEGERLGKAARRLVSSEEDEARIKRRLDAIATSQSIEELSNHMRGFIQLLKAKDVPLDYQALAEDLFKFQMPDAQDSVRLRWGQDFYRIPKINDEENLPKEKE